MADATLLSDAELLARFVRGRDTGAFEVLILRHGPMVLQVCRRVLHDSHDAEDVAQAVFLTLAQKAPRLQEVRSLAGWLHRVAFRLALDLRRSRVRRRSHEIAAGAGRDGDGNELLKLQPLLDAAIDQLPERYRAAVLLHHLEGHTQQQAAELLGCKASALSMRLTRARDLLRRRLSVQVDGEAVGTLLAGAGAVAFPPELAATVAGLAGHLLAGKPIAAAATSLTRAMVWSQRAVRMIYVAKLKAAAAVVVGVSLAAGGVVGAGRVLAGPPATMAGNSPTSRPELGAAPSTINAYLELAFQEAATLTDRNDQIVAYEQIMFAQLAAGDVAGAEQTLPRIPDEKQRSYMSEEIALAAAERGNFDEARAVNERIQDDYARRWGEARIAKIEAIGLLKKGKGEEALQVGQEQDEPKARMQTMCALVREFALAKDMQRARKALDLAKKAMAYLDPRDGVTAPSYVAEAEAFAGDVQGACARASTIGDPPLRDNAYSLIALAQVQCGDIEGANQTLQSVRTSGGGRATGYADCAHASLNGGDQENARRFVQQAIASYSADPDMRRRWALQSIVEAQVRLGDMAGAMALARGESYTDARSQAYRKIAWQQTLREGPAAAHAWVQGLQSPLERAYAWAGIAMGLAERQKRADASAAASAANAYVQLALQEAAKLTSRTDQIAVYEEIVFAQLEVGDIAGAREALPRIPDEASRGYMGEEIALTFAKQGNFTEARAVSEQIEFDEARHSCEGRIARMEAVDLLKKGKGEEALRLAQDQEEPNARMMALCSLVREFALAKDTQHARKALELAGSATAYLESWDRTNAPSHIAAAEVFVGDVQGARARVSTMDPRLRDMAYCAVAAAQIETGDVEGANQTLQTASLSGSGRTTGYADCANESLNREDKANARQFAQQAIASYSATPDSRMRRWALQSIVEAQMRLGDTAAAMALARGEKYADARSMAYRKIAWQQTLREGPAAAYAWAQGLQLPLERAYAWSGIARGLAERQKLK